MSEQFVLVHEATGDEYVFSSRSEYVNTMAQGGYRDKDESPAPQERVQVFPVPSRQSEPAPVDRPVRPEPPHA